MAYRERCVGFNTFHVMKKEKRNKVVIERRLNKGQWRTQDFFRVGGGSTNSIEDRGQRMGIWGRNSLVSSGGSCNLVQEISFHIVKFS